MLTDGELLRVIDDACERLGVSLVEEKPAES